MFSRRFAAVVTVVIVLAFVVVAVAPAFAASSAAALPMHAALASSTPADGATVTSADEVVLTFNEDVNPDFVAVRVTGPDGSEVEGDPTVEGRSVRQPLAAALPAGRHQVAYRVVSADGHPVAGTLTFTTAATPASGSPAATETASATAAATPTADAASPTPSTAAAPVSGEADDGIPWLVIAVVGIVAAAVLGALLRLLSRPRTHPDDGRTPPA